MTIKAIETQYKGYRFRSRLEARWAVFFDALGIEWDYEKEGYSVDGLCYLPDFFIKNHFGVDVIIDIKPELPDSGGEEARKIMVLADAMRGKAMVLVLVGQPNPDHPIPMACIHGNAEITGVTLGFIDVPDHQQFCLIFFNIENTNDQQVWCNEGRWRMAEGDDAIVLTGDQRITDALNKARSARFEFGEKG